MTETNIVTIDDPEYRAWMYCRIDGEMVSKVVTGPEAKELYEDGWRMTPADFAEDDSNRESPEFQAIADDMAVVMNTLLNINKIEDRAVLVEFAEDFLKLKVHPNTKINTLRKRINKRATELELFE